ncbi:MAG: two-component regulator propeller domain-containing protein [Ignavibacteriota bacterium]
MLAIRPASGRELRDFHHSAWTSENGLGAVFDIQQAPDGYLWLTTSRGVFRFDGTHFESIEEATNRAAFNSELDSVFVSVSGAVWLKTRSAGLLQWKNGQLTTYPDRHCTPALLTDSVAEDRDGALWILGSAGLFRLRNGACDAIGEEHAYPGGFPAAVLMDKAGTLWVKTPSGVLLYLPRGESQFRVDSYGAGKVGDFAYIHEAPDGSVWLSDEEGLRRVTPVPPAGQNPSHKKRARFGNFTFTADGSLWAAARSGIQRFGSVSEFATGESVDPAQGESFTPSQGLSSDVVWKLIADREGNLWVGTNSGLDQLRRNALSTLPVPPTQEHQFGIAAGDNGSVWIGSRGLPLTEILADGASRVFARTRQTVCIRRDRNGAIWSAGLGDAHLWRTSGANLDPVPYPGDNVEVAASVAVDKNDEPWISTFAPNVYHRSGSKWENQNENLGRKPGVLGAMLGDDAGNVWFAFSNKLVEWDGAQYLRYSFPDGPLNISVVTLAVRGDRVWLGGTGGDRALSKGRVS